MAVRRRSKSCGCRLSLRPIGCASALSVTYSATAAAVAAFGAIQMLFLYLYTAPKYDGDTPGALAGENRKSLLCRNAFNHSIETLHGIVTNKVVRVSSL